MVVPVNELQKDDIVYRCIIVSEKGDPWPTQGFICDDEEEIAYIEWHGCWYNAVEFAYEWNREQTNNLDALVAGAQDRAAKKSSHPDSPGKDTHEKNI